LRLMSPLRGTTSRGTSVSGVRWLYLLLALVSFAAVVSDEVEAQAKLSNLSMCGAVRQKCALTCNTSRAQQLAAQCGCAPSYTSSSNASSASSSAGSSSSGISSSQGGSSSGSSAPAEPQLLTVGLECVTKNIDNTRTAYFSYNNTTGANLTVVTNISLGSINAFTADPAVSAQPPTTFKPGVSKATVVVQFTKGPLTWVVKGAGMQKTEATASDQSPECPRVVPIAECRGYEQGLFKVKLGYQNPASFEQAIPVGKANQFSPGAADRGQPVRFFTGLNRAVFSAILDGPQESVTWNINSEKVVIDKTIPACTGMCIDAPLATIKGDLDQVAIDLSALMNRASAVLVSVKDKKYTKAAKTVRARDRRDSIRSGKKAAEYERIARALTIQFPAVVKLCPESPQFCSTVDRQGTIDALRGLYANQRNSVVRTMARVMFRSTGATSRRQRIVKDARALEQKGLGQLRNLPRFATECK